jgi:hypothetical protein
MGWVDELYSLEIFHESLVMWRLAQEKKVVVS